MKIKNKSQPLVTIITPLYNAEKYIAQTIQSVINQTYQNWEIIIVDDCSIDSSREIVKQYEKNDSRIRLIQSETNFGGPARPRNIGIENAKGEYIAFLDADDVWLEEKLEKQLKVFKNNEVDIVHTLANKIDENSVMIGEFKNQRVFNKLKYILNQKNIIYYTNYINVNSVLMKRKGVIRFNEDINLVAMEDWNLWIESVFNNKKIVLLEEKLLKYRVHSASISNRSSDIGFRKSLYLLSLKFLKKEIPLRHYMLSSFFTFSKILVKNL